MQKTSKRVKINVEEAEGRKVAENIYNEFGVFLLRENVILNSTLISSLVKYNVKEIYVYENQ